MPSAGAPRPAQDMSTRRGTPKLGACGTRVSICTPRFKKGPSGDRLDAYPTRTIFRSLVSFEVSWRAYGTKLPLTDETTTDRHAKRSRGGERRVTVSIRR